MLCCYKLVVINVDDWGILSFFASNLPRNRVYREEAVKLTFNYVEMCRVHVLCV